MQKTKLSLILTLAAVFIAAMFVGMAGLTYVPVSAEGNTSAYYYSQLTSAEAKAFYNALSDMEEEGVLKSGTQTWDLVEKGYLSNKEYSETQLTAAFGAGRDAFMLDNADLFYVDFDNLSVRMLTDGNSYKITLGIGREDSYLADGFTAQGIDSDIAAFEEKVSEIVSAASEKVGTYDKTLCVYEMVMDSSVYALEFDAGDDADYVRCAYGVLVKGKGVCQSFSQAVKTILDRLGITNVVVQGMYIDGGEEQPHMWNYVLMDDNRWYILDATMDNARRDAGDTDSLRYFLMNGSVAAGMYAPNGVISSSAFEFEYPSLSMVDYTSPSGNFVIETDLNNSGTTEYKKVSYNGMGLQTAAEQGYYILATYSVNTETDWFYVVNYFNYYIVPNTNYNLDDYDFDNYFNALFLGNTADCIYAVTTDAPSTSTVKNDIYYTGNNITDKSSAVITGTAEAAPYALAVSPDALRFYIGSSYNVTITFSGDLELIDGTLPVTVTVSVPDGVTLSSSSVVTNVSWSGSTPNQVSFTFTPDKNYSADRCNYIFIVNNLIGKTSGKAPMNTILTAMYKPSFSCPADPLSYCTAVASVPLLIADSDLSADGWTYTGTDGNEYTVSGSSLNNKISLVATTYSSEQNKASQSAVEDYNSSHGSNITILSSATYDLKLNLCDIQVNYLNGNKVKVMVPFPEGYSASSVGVSFKAYHFADDGSIEEVECYCTEYGIILFCSSFSAYTVAAVDGGSDGKTVFITEEGCGSVSCGNLVTIQEGNSFAVIIKADDGYCIDSITVNGKAISLNGATEYELAVEYSKLESYTTVIVKFAYAEVVNGEIDSGYTLSFAEVAAAEGETSEGTELLLKIAVAVIAILSVIAAAAIIYLVILKKRIK